MPGGSRRSVVACASVDRPKLQRRDRKRTFPPRRAYGDYVDTHMPALSYTGLFILQALAQGYKFGFDIMDVTNLPGGTVYPALRRLESLSLVRSDWETDKEARENARPRRRYYELTAAGKAQLADAESRYRAVSKLFPKRGRA
jgi:PadR family transcriptional regulator PadR